VIRELLNIKAFLKNEVVVVYKKVGVVVCKLRECVTISERQWLALQKVNKDTL